MKKHMSLLKSAPAAILFAMAFAGCRGSQEQTVQALAAKSVDCNLAGLDTEKTFADRLDRDLEVERTNPRCADVVEKTLAFFACASELSCEDLKVLNATPGVPNASKLPKDLPCREESRA